MKWHKIQNRSQKKSQSCVPLMYWTQVMKQNMSQIRQRLSIYFFRKKSLLGNFSGKLLKFSMYCTHLTYHISLKGDTDCKVDASCLGQHTNLKHIMISNCTGLWIIYLSRKTGLIDNLQSDISCEESKDLQLSLYGKTRPIRSWVYLGARWPAQCTLTV